MTLQVRPVPAAQGFLRHDDIKPEAPSPQNLKVEGV